MTTGPCARRVVKATIVTTSGERFIGTNSCATAQPVCPRGDMPAGVGYELCKSVCNQHGHAEHMALLAADCGGPEGPDLRNATCYVEGHSYACDGCLRLLRSAGVFRVLFQAPPDFGHSGMDSMLGSVGQ